MILRKATVEDIPEVLCVFEQARLAQRRLGFRQWEDGYPSEEVLRADIMASIGFVLDDNGKAAGYVAIAAGDDEYDRHPELWDIRKRYAVFHRVAIGDAYRGRNVSAVLFDLAERHAHELGVDFVRVDTGLENRPMQHILAKRGYSGQGPCRFIWGPRLAYEKPLA